MKCQLKSQAGFTLTELLIAIQLSFIVTSLAYAGYKFSVKLWAGWQTAAQLEQQIALTTDAFTRRTDQIAEIIHQSGTSILCKTTSGDTLRLEVDIHLKINDLRVGNGVVRIESGQFNKLDGLEPGTSSLSLSGYWVSDMFRSPFSISGRLTRLRPEVAQE